jgi:hypothetical protein
MKSHELAEGLRALAKALKSGPNIDVGLIDFQLPFGSRQLTPSANHPGVKDDLPLALSALLSLSRIDKREWTELIADIGLDIPITTRDSNRDVVGKVLRHLEAEPIAREMLMKRVKNKNAKASPELARALSSLLATP